MNKENSKSDFNIINFINIFLIVFMYALRSITDGIFIARGIENNIWINLKYVVLLIAIIFCFLQLKYHNDKYIYKSEFLKGIIAVVTLLLISLFCMLFSGNFFLITLEEIFKLVLPIVYAFLILNTFSLKDIYISMCFILFFSIIGYVLEIGINNFTIDNFLSIDFMSSYSPFESNASCGTAIAMCTFFMYFKKNKILKYLSLIFAIFTFKRLSVIFALILCFIPYLVNIDYEVKKNSKTLVKILFIIGTFAYMLFLSPSSAPLVYNIFGIDQYQLTMGRSLLLDNLSSGNFISSGLGSSTLFLGRSLEMDLIKIFFETGIIGLIAFVWCYWDCSGNKLYTNIYMLFQFINLLTSHSLTSAFSWTLVFLIIGSISYKQVGKNSIFKDK